MLVLIAEKILFADEKDKAFQSGADGAHGKRVVSDTKKLPREGDGAERHVVGRGGRKAGDRKGERGRIA